MTYHADDPVTIKEPGTHDDVGRDNIWLRGLWMIVFAILIRFAGLVLGLATLFQWLWMLFNNKTPNEPVARFGDDLGDWYARAAEFQTGRTDDKPFPFAPWGPERR